VPPAQPITAHTWSNFGQPIDITLPWNRYPDARRRWVGPAPRERNVARHAVVSGTAAALLFSVITTFHSLRRSITHHGYLEPVDRQSCVDEWTLNAATAAPALASSPSPSRPTAASSATQHQLNATSTIRHRSGLTPTATLGQQSKCASKL